MPRKQWKLHRAPFLPSLIAANCFIWHSFLYSGLCLFAKIYYLVIMSLTNRGPNRFIFYESLKTYLRKVASMLLSWYRIFGDDGHVMDTDIPQTHKIEKQFYCSQCPKSFPYLSHLRKHQVIHFDEKPFNCDICNKSFRRWDYFYRAHEIRVISLDKMFLSDTRKLYITLKTIN